MQRQGGLLPNNVRGNAAIACKGCLGEGHYGENVSETETRMDDIDCEILAEFQANGRIPFAELGRRVGLSTPAAIERVRRLEEREVILGYRTLVDPAKVDCLCGHS